MSTRLLQVFQSLFTQRYCHLIPALGSILYDQIVKSSKSCWDLVSAGSVGHGASLGGRQRCVHTSCTVILSRSNYSTRAKNLDQREVPASDRLTAHWYQTGLNTVLPMTLVVSRVVAWLSGSTLVSINVVTLRRARLILGWVTRLWVNHLDTTSHPGQLSLSSFQDW